MEAWRRAKRQHGVIARSQLLDLGFSPKAIKHRVSIGRLHPIRRGVYAVGRSSLTLHGRWMAAVLACGDRAVLSHSSAAALWRIGFEHRSVVELSLPSQSHRNGPGLLVHRRTSLQSGDVTTEYGIPVTTPVRTLVDLALRLDRRGIERAINEADKYDLVHPPELREALDECVGEPGLARLRQILDRRTFRLTKEELERRFLPLAGKAGLPLPLPASG
jgi:predicted transcriptional regulator of viral defense system